MVPGDAPDLATLPVGGAGLALQGSVELCWLPGAQTTGTDPRQKPCFIWHSVKSIPLATGQAKPVHRAVFPAATELHTPNVRPERVSMTLCLRPATWPTEVCSHHWPPWPPALLLPPAGHPAPQGLPRCLLLQGWLQKGRRAG